MEVNNQMNDIEYILNDIGGAFGKYQIYNYLMLSYTMFVTGLFVLDYVFATLYIDHRCKIDECDQIDESIIADTDFYSNWLQYSTPQLNGKPDPCHRYEVYDANYDQNEYICDMDFFNRSASVYCGSGSMIYRTDEISIINEFNLTCEENFWKVPMVGTWSNIGRLFFLPIVGYLSDWLGRKGVLVTTTLISSVLKIAKSFAVDYTTFVILEMLDAGMSSAIYPTALILAMELATVEHSTLVSCLVLIPYPLGQVATALFASYFHHYKLLLRVLAVFGIAILPFIWILPDSFRWLLVNRKYSKAVKWVEMAAKTNGLTLSPKTYDIIAMKCKNENTDENVKSSGTFIDLIRSCSLATRLLICIFCWISSTLITYGVSIVSVSMPGDKYVNFMIISFAGLPSGLVTYFMLKYMSRRWSMFISFCITGLSILASKYYSTDITISLVFFFSAKLFINHSFTYLYVYTNEMWPTILRHRVMGFCSMIGRFGSIAAPLAPLLATINEMLPFYIFSAFAIVSAVIILFLPETFRQEKLPDSIDDIKKIKDKNSR